MGVSTGSLLIVYWLYNTNTVLVQEEYEWPNRPRMTTSHIPPLFMMAGATYVHDFLLWESPSKHMFIH